MIENRRGAGDFSDPSEKTAALKGRTLSRNEILIAAATSRQFLPSLAVAIGAYDQIGNMLGWHFLTLAIDSATTDTGIDWTLLNPAPFVILAMIGFLAIVGTLMYILFLYRSFGIARKSNELSIRSGFTNIQEIDLPIQRIQSVEINQTLLQILLGYGQLKIRVIGHSEGKNKNTILHPCLAKSDWQPFLDEFVPGFTISNERVRAPIRPLPLFLFRSLGMLTLLSVIGVAFLFSLFSGPWALSTLLLLVPMFAVASGIGFANYWFSAVGRGSENITVVTQPWSRTTSVVRKNAFQQYFRQQSWLQQRLNTATFGVQIASGPIGVKHRIHNLDPIDVDAFETWLGSP